jgi:Ni,Fe-hydrogenase I large subunit
VHIKDGAIANYQCVVPSTWNAGPRDAAGKRGPYEEALLGTPVADPEQPLELLRTIHSFDPCIACGVHVLDKSGRQVAQVRAL